MVFSILIILFVGIIAFFHYVQGLFSATLSAMITVLAAVLAVSYNETIVDMMKNRLPDYVNSLVLCTVFAVTYIVLRVIFDAAIPGNVRTPNIVDKVGAGLMGIVSGIFATGIFAIAVQMLPFDPGISFMGYGRYALGGTRSINGGIPRVRQANIDATTSGEMQDASFDPPAKETGLLLPVDDWVIATVDHLSNGGSLAGDRPLESIHPDYLQELFGERLGMQTSGRRVALQLGTDSPIDVTGVYTAASLPATDGAVKELRTPGFVPAHLDKANKVAVGPGQAILVVRIKVKSSATDDEDGIFRFSTGSIHLVGEPQPDTYKDYYPIGTLRNASMVLLDKPDDFLFVKGDGSFDAVFLVDDSLISGGKNSKQLKAGTFISVKRFGLEDLSSHDVTEPIPYDAGVNDLRHGTLLERLKLPTPTVAPVTPQRQVSQPPAASNTPPTPTPTPTPTPPTPSDTAGGPPQPAPGKELSSEDLVASVDTKFLAPGSISIGTNVADQEAKDAPVAGGKISLTGGQISSATIDPTATLTKLSEGASPYSQLLAPQDKAMVQVQISPYSSNWSDWMALYGKTNLVDANGNTYNPNGAYALAKTADGRALFLRYDYQHVVTLTPPESPMDGTVYLIFLVPSGTDIKSLKMGDKSQNLAAVLHVP